ncbi:MAG: M23 family metallopeptidase [Rhodospirillales bacterium]|nr:M23 family metallopeptidase [Rhodospirillales bacterium]
MKSILITAAMAAAFLTGCQSTQPSGGIASVKTSAAKSSSVETGKIYSRGETHKIKVVLPSNAPSIGSDYGATRGYFNDQRSEPHLGIDIQVPYGSPVIAAADGRVEGFKRGSEGWTISIRHTDGLVSWYDHLSSTRINDYIHVKRGEVIGKSGKTGSSNSHLHFGATKHMNRNVHLYWLGGEGNIVCFDENGSQLENGTDIFTYPIKCL